METQPFERMSLADQHAVRLHMRMMIMLARELPTREARIKHMVGQTFCGPHHYVTKDSVVVDEGTAVYIADLLDAETPAEREAHLQQLEVLRCSEAASYRTRPQPSLGARHGFSTPPAPVHPPP